MILFHTAAVPTARHFPLDILELGAPNLLVTAPGMCGISGGFRNLERGVQPLARKADPKISKLPRLLPVT